MTAKHAHQMPFFVRQKGLKSYDPVSQGAITGHETEAEAQSNAEDRNFRAQSMGLEARYEVLPGEAS